MNGIVAQRPIIHRPSLVLFAVALAAAGLLTQCRLASHSITGFDFKPVVATGDRGQCVKQCNETWRDESSAENQRWRDELRTCGGDATCIATASATHRDNEESLKNQREDCKRSCYNEGSGGGGR